MRKVINLTVFLLFQLFSFYMYGANSAHLAELNSKFPNGLLGDDYGVLTVKDLALNNCGINPPKFTLDDLNVYEYWICFETKNVLPTCSYAGFDESEGHVGNVNVEARDSEFVYQFFEPRPWEIKSCRSFVKSLKRIMKGTSHACVSASSITKEEKNEKGQNERIGMLGRFKTIKGCEGRECVLTKEFKKKYCPNLKF